MPELTAENNCPHCGDNLVPGKLFCPNCGLALAPPNQKVALDAYITAKVQQEVALLTNSQTAIVREIGNKAEDEVWTRMKRYSWVVGGVIILLGLYGFTSIRDAKKTIVDESLRRVEPVVKQVENRAQNAQSKLWEVEKQLPGVTDSLNKTATLADEQRSRIEGQSSEVNSKLKEFQTAAKKADQLSTQFQASVNNSQRRLNETHQAIRYSANADHTSNHPAIRT
jgi:hypothetical protein